MQTPEEMFALARRLIDIPSVSGDEANCAEFLAAYLRDECGYQVELQTVAASRQNVLAFTRDSPTLVFSTHLDTVPPFIAAREDAANIYGRGACDAKGIIAAQICAAARLRAMGVENLGLLFTVDEEVSSDGAKIANLHPRAGENKFLINGEPTENKLALGSKGSLRLRLTAKGRAAHSAYPEQGESAIEKLLDVLQDLRRAQLPVNDFFGATTCNIGTISGGTKSNVIPAQATSDLHFRLVTPSAEILKITETIARARVVVETLSVSEPQKLLAVEGFASEIVRFTTDIPHLANWGEPLLLGAGSIHVAHTDREFVAKSDLIESVKLYVELAQKLLRS